MDTLRYSVDNNICLVWSDGQPLRCPTQEDMDTLHCPIDVPPDKSEKAAVDNVKLITKSIGGLLRKGGGTMDEVDDIDREFYLEGVGD